MAKKTTKKKATKTKKTEAKSCCTTKSPAKKSSCCSTSKSSNSQKTIVMAKADIGWGNDLYIRGEGAGLSWDKGSLMKNNGSDEWVWSSSKASKNGVTFKLLLNDEVWCEGENMCVCSGKELVAEPRF